MEVYLHSTTVAHHGNCPWGIFSQKSAGHFFSQKSNAITQNLLDLESHSGFNKYPSSEPVAYSHQFGLLLGHLSDISNKFLTFSLQVILFLRPLSAAGSCCPEIFFSVLSLCNPNSPQGFSSHCLRLALMWCSHVILDQISGEQRSSKRFNEHPFAWLLIYTISPCPNYVSVFPVCVLPIPGCDLPLLDPLPALPWGLHSHDRPACLAALRPTLLFITQPDLLSYRKIVSLVEKALLPPLALLPFWRLFSTSWA